MSLSWLSQLKKAHDSFCREIRASAQFDASHISILPSIFFVFSAFALVHAVIHRRTFATTPRRVWIYREIGFHWTFFYVIRVWFLIVKLARLGTSTLEAKVGANLDKLIHVHPHLLHTSALILLLLLSLTPAVLILVNYMAMRSVPNFLMWVGEDPWLRSEIGLAGHYLDRPPTFSLPQRADCAYRIHRSISYESVTNKLSIIRISRSMETTKCAKSLENLLR